jgi:hypothetical protein
MKKDYSALFRNGAKTFTKENLAEFLKANKDV